MGNFIDIIIFAVIAAFLVLRLRGVLGKRGGHEPDRPFDPFGKKDRKEETREEAEDKIVHLPDRSNGQRERDEEMPETLRGRAETVEDVAGPGGLTQIKMADSNFDPRGFVEGARTAFEMVVAAFAQGDTKTLRPLLSNDVYDDFAGAIKSREEAKETLETTLIGIKEAEIIEAELQGKTAFVTVKFVSEQVNVTRDAEGKVVDGDENHVATITDIWTFARNTRSRDPNWTLVATRSSN